jgi:hypothetical protein
MCATTEAVTRQDRQEGFALVMVLALMIPLVITAAAFSSVMVSRSNELRTEHDEELAFLTAEAGVDDAIYRGRTGTLTAGTNITFNFGTSRWYKIEPTHLKVDGLDNDGDGQVDEADEDVYQVVVTGQYRKSKRRLAAYLGPVPLLPSMVAALSTQDTSISIDLKGTPKITGANTKVDGTADVGSVPGLTIAAPGTVAYLNSELTPAELSKISGTPTLAVGPVLDIPTIVAQVKNIANLVLTSDKYSAYNFGDASAGTANITYREGNLQLAGNSRGAGILVVAGDLEMKGTFRFDGVIIVLGQVYNSAGSAAVYGSLVQGPAGGSIVTKGTFDLYYSTEAIAVANSVSGRYVSFNGWQELSRN